MVGRNGFNGGGDVDMKMGMVLVGRCNEWNVTEGDSVLLNMAM